MSNKLQHLTNLDANEQIFFTRELEFKKAKAYDVLREELVHRTFLPVSNEADAAAQSIVYEQYDQVGVAKIIKNYADDLPLANVKGQEFVSKIVSLGMAFIYSLMDIRASQKANKRLPDRQMNAAIRGHAEKEELIAALGDTDTGLTGFMNNANVSLISADDPGAGKAWIADSKTPAQIVKDMNDLAQKVVTQTRERHKPDTLLLPSAEFGHISSTQNSTSSDVTILKWFLANNPYIKNVGVWPRLNLADAAGTGPRMVAYTRSPDMLTLEIPQEFEMLPVQQENFSFKTPTHSRIGGVLIYYPLSLAYMDDI